jgi:uncharacterized membrane protein YfhO
LQRLDTERIRIRTRVETGQLLLVQETYDVAWHAYSGGRAVPVECDALGFMLLDPGPGDHEVLLQFEPPLENRAGGWAWVVSMLAVTWLIFRRESKPAK